MLWAALRLHESLYTDVLTSIQRLLPAADLHHVTAVGRAHAAKAVGAAADSGTRSAGGVHVRPL